MKTTFQIPRVLQQYCGGCNEIGVDGATVGEVLEQVKKQYPDLYGCICDETGHQRQHINLFINNDMVPRAAFETQIEADSVISVFQAVSGG